MPGKITIQVKASVSWHKFASCRDIDPQLFFPDDANGDDSIYDTGRAYCRDCPVRLPCLKFGMTEKWGLYGGLSPKQRRRLRRRQPIDRGDVCGSCSSEAEISAISESSNW